MKSTDARTQCVNNSDSAMILGNSGNNLTKLDEHTVFLKGITFVWSQDIFLSTGARLKLKLQMQ